MYEFEKKMLAITLIAETLNPIPLRELAQKLEAMADAIEDGKTIASIAT